MVKKELTLTEKVEKLLADETISAYRIWKDTGVNESVISRLRNKKRALGNIKLSVAEKLGKYWTEQQEH